MPCNHRFSHDYTDEDEHIRGEKKRVTIKDVYYCDKCGKKKVVRRSYTEHVD